MDILAIVIIVFVYGIIFYLIDRVSAGKDTVKDCFNTLPRLKEPRKVVEEIPRNIYDVFHRAVENASYASDTVQLLEVLERIESNKQTTTNSLPEGHFAMSTDDFLYIRDLLESNDFGENDSHKLNTIFNKYMSDEQEE